MVVKVAWDVKSVVVQIAEYGMRIGNKKVEGLLVF
jgi:hypothetical protein